MRYISSDTNVWIDFLTIGEIGLPFQLPYTYIMNEDAIEDELLTPPGFKETLLEQGLLPVEMTIEEFFLAEKYGTQYLRLSIHDRIALAIAKLRGITLLTGDGALRNAAKKEGVPLLGTLGILDQLHQQNLISRSHYRDCLKHLAKYNGGVIRLPKDEIAVRLDKLHAEEMKER